MCSDSCSNYSDNLSSDYSDDSSQCEFNFIKTYIDKEIFILDYDHTIKLHKLSSNMQQEYEEKLYDILYKLKTHHNKKIYIVSYNLKPKFNNEYLSLFEGIYIPVSTKDKEFYHLQKKLYCSYMSWCDSYYRYIPKHIQIKEIADKHNIDISKVIFFDDNEQQIRHARKNGIHSILVDPLIGIEL